MSETLRVAVLSDIHAGETSHGDTFVVAEPPLSRPNENPLRDLAQFISSHNIAADLLLCPGDLGNRAHAGGRVYGWGLLQDIAANLGGPAVATVGNHDVDTHTPTADQAQLLKLLTPSFPVGDIAHASRYWSDGFYLDDSDPRYRLLNINTCADFPPHPGTSAASNLISAHDRTVERGSVSVERLARIEAELAQLGEKSVNIALMHHHPVEHSRHELFKDTYGPVENGEKLIELLENATQSGRWMLIHGHKHIPDFTVDGGSANSPMVLCAASLGGHLWQPIAAVARNQFHIIEFEIDRRLGLPITRGLVRSWAWSFGRGWTEAPPTTGLPAEFGFGALNDPRDLADQIASNLTDLGLEFERWVETTTKFPTVRYLGPKDLSLFEDRLETAGYLLERTRGFAITTIARKATWT